MLNFCKFPLSILQVRMAAVGQLPAYDSTFHDDSNQAQCCRSVRIIVWTSGIEVHTWRTTQRNAISPAGHDLPVSPANSSAKALDRSNPELDHFTPW